MSFSLSLIFKGIYLKVKKNKPEDIIILLYEEKIRLLNLLKKVILQYFFRYSYESILNIL